MSRVVFVYCEGRHDITFAERSLGSLETNLGIQRYGGAVGALPAPLGESPGQLGVLLTQLMAPDRATLRSTGVRAAASRVPPILANVLVRGTGDGATYWLFFDSHGKDSHNEVRRFISGVEVVLGAFTPRQVTAHAHAFLNDADRDCASVLDEVRSRKLGGVIEVVSPLQSGQWQQAGGVPVGCFAFTDRSGVAGTLEDSLAELGEAALGDRWRRADAFIEQEARVGRPGLSPAGRVKATLTAAGQVLRPGSPMSEMLVRDLIPRDHFGAHPTSQALARFLTEVPWP